MSPGFKGRVLFPDPSIFCFRLSVGSPQLLQEPEILSGAQNPRCSAGMHCHRPPTATGGATWVCSRPAPSRLPETPALCTVPALTSCLPAGGCSISVGGIQVLGPGNLMISEVSVQHSSVYVCAVSQSARNSDPTIAQGILLVQGEPQGPARECPGSPHPPREPG